MNPRGQIQLVPKKYIKTVIGKSPDQADAMCLACYRGDPQPLQTESEDVIVPASSRSY
jgi:hypothetical protein